MQTLFNSYKNFTVSQDTVRIGTSISLQRITELFGDNQPPVEVVTYIVEELGITDIRLDLRWEYINRKEGHYSLRAYEEVLGYLFSKKVQITLNIGPLKTLRYPEEFPPQWVLEKLDRIPGAYSRISKEHDIADYGQEYVHELCALLNKTFTKHELRCIKTIQPENEGFNFYGQYKWIVTMKNIHRTIETALHYLPNRDILLNSAGRFQLRLIADYFNTFAFQSLGVLPKIGLDYYYNTQYTGKGFIAPYIDGINTSFPWDAKPKQLPYLIHTPFEYEVTEAQCEPWNEYRGPGESVEEVAFVLARCIDTAPEQNKPLLVRLWGAEFLAKQKNTEIQKFIKSITKRT